MKIRTLTAVIASCLLGVTACGSSSDEPAGTQSGPSTSASADSAITAHIPQSIRDRGKIVNYVNVPNPPMEFEDGSGTLIGFDVELADALSGTLGIPIENQTTPDFAQLLPSITSGRADMVLSGLTDRAERQETVSFVDYFKSGYQFLIRAEDKTKITAVSDLCGQTVVASTGTSYPDVVATLSESECTSQGKQAIAIIGGTSTPDQLLQLTTGRAVAVMMSVEILGYQVTQDSGKWAALGEPTQPGYYGIIFPKDEPDFGKAIQMALQKLIDDGTYGELLDKYGLTDSAIDSPTINAGEID